MVEIMEKSEPLKNGKMAVFETINLLKLISRKILEAIMFLSAPGEARALIHLAFWGTF